MKRILFMVDMYYPKPRAVGICVHRLAGELTKLGYKVHVIAYRQKNEAHFEDFEGVFVHRIAPRLDMKLQEYGESRIDSALGKISYKTAGMIRKIQKLIFLPWFPLVSPLMVNRYYRKMLSLNREYGYDCIMATYLPPEPLFAGAMIKKKLKNIKYGAYILDSLISQSGRKYLPSNLIKKLTWKFEKMVYETADMVINPEGLRNHHQSSKYHPYRNKIVFTGTHQFVPKQPVLTNKLYDNHKKHLVYMGTLLKDFRSPDYLYRLFQRINHSGEFQLHFYTRGSCEDDLLRYEAESGGAVLRHGFVEHREVDNILANSDFLINLGVPDSTLDSSKIFEYMSTCKPIIHFYYVDDDYCLQYFEKYNLSLAIKMDEHVFDDNAIIFQEFLLKTYGKTINKDKFEEALKEEIPMHVMKHIENLAHGCFDNN